ncbi:helix-turn-helix domain-containing protein [Micromonospora sp. KC721]|uniref:helix-turn-helix domain-containing protein n=1 Tax=Micromonospora sp. KC721 TaxID=2530380 RepID=UPI001404D9FD|nr:helix-turn-helix domain-containing protein [Micromonospora sp. KC721]
MAEQHDDYTYAEAAQRLRIAETTLRRWVSKGRVPCHRLGRKVRFTDDDIAAAYRACPALARR